MINNLNLIRWVVSGFVDGGDCQERALQLLVRELDELLYREEPAVSTSEILERVEALGHFGARDPLILGLYDGGALHRSSYLNMLATQRSETARMALVCRVLLGAEHQEESDDEFDEGGPR